MKSTKSLVAVTEVNKEFALHLFVEDQDDWTIWLDTVVAELDGLCISTGRTRKEAVDHALENLAHLTVSVLKLKSRG